MQTPINKDNIVLFADTNADLIKNAPRALVMEFHGLSYCPGISREVGRLGRFLAERDIIYAIPYYGPWDWMNDKAVKYNDEVVDALFARFGVGSLPVVSSGLSMGGLGALVWCVYTRHNPVACAANCPVCDLPYHYTEREDLPRTIYSAFSHYDMSLEDAMKTASPLHLADRLPDIPYAFFLAENDEEVDFRMHGDRLIPKLRERGLSVERVFSPGRGHCDFTEEAINRYYGFLALDFES
ncbi:MAG: hypothetical protein IJR90_09520 [Clostridia bacterium]|nr:hypothetical protein [Clostridia bacterium]